MEIKDEKQIPKTNDKIDCEVKCCFTLTKYEYFKTDFQSWEQYHVLVLYFSSKYLEAYEPVW